MKTKIRRYSRQTMAIILSVIMVMTCLVVGQITTVNAGVTFVAGDYIYFKNQKGGLGDQWITSGGEAWIHLWNDTTSKDYKFSLASGTANSADAIYRAQVADAGTYDNFIMTRNKSGSTGPWNNKWNQTGDCTCASGKNYITAITKDSTSSTWSNLYVVSVSAGSNGSCTTTPLYVESGASATLPSVTPNDGYTFKNWTGTTGLSFTDASTNASATVSATADGTATANYKRTLTTPESSGVTATAAKTGTTSFTVSNHSTISSIDGGVTYELYKGGTSNGNKLTEGTDYTYSNGEFTIAKKASKTGSYYIKAKTSDSESFNDSGFSSAVTVTISATTLTTPSISFDSSTVTAAVGESVTLTDANYNANLAVDSSFTYEVYKDGTAAGNKITSGFTDNGDGTFTIDKKYSKHGDYYLKAVTSDADVYSSSSISTQATLTVNRTNLAQPIISLNKATANNTDTDVTVTVTNYDSLKDHCDFELSGSTAGAISSSGVYTITEFTKAYYHGGSNGTNAIKVTATLKEGKNEYYTVNGSGTSSDSATSNLVVYKPNYTFLGEVQKIEGSGKNSASWDANSGIGIDTPTGTPGIYTYTFVTKSDGGDVYLGLYDIKNTLRRAFKLGDTLKNTNGADVEVPDEGIDDDDNLYVYSYDSGGAIKFSQNTTYTITIDQTQQLENQPFGKITIQTGLYSYKAVAKAQTFNLETDSYNDVTNATGSQGTVTPTALTPVTQGSAASLTATPGSGYEFAGWFNNADCTGDPVANTAAASPVPAANTTYYALFKQTAPTRRTVTISDVANAIVTATYNGNTYTEGQNFTVPDGASITIASSADSGYRISATTPGTGAQTITSNTTVSATVVKTYTVTYIKYGPCDPSSVTINGSAATSSTSKTFDAGSTITLVESPGTNNKFMGWYSDGSDLTGSLLSTDSTYVLTNDLQANTVVYGFFGYDKYYLGGYLRPSNYGDSVNFNRNFMEFTADPDDPWLYTVTYQKVGTQYALVTMVGDKMYNTAGTSSAQTASGAASGGSVINYDSNTTNKWKEDSDSYNNITYTWDARTTQLSWSLSSISYENKTVILADDTNATHDYLWSVTGTTDYQIGNNFPGAALANYPQITIDGKTYRLIIINNSDITGNDFYVILSKGSDSCKSTDTQITKGEVNTITWDGTHGDDASTSHTAISANAITLTESDTTSRTAPATASFSQQLAGAPVDIHVYPDNDHVATVTVTGHDSSDSIDFTRKGNDFTFIMPEEDVEVAVTYSEKVYHDVTVVPDELEANRKGTVSVSPSRAAVGDIVTVNLEPDPAGSYTNNSLSIYKTGDDETTITPVQKTKNVSYSFTMPDYGVSVTAQFTIYSADASFWYDGYQRQDNSSNAGKLVKQDGTGTTADLDNLRFTEAMYNGNKYAYLQVTRPDSDPDTNNNYQEFLVKSSSDGSGTSASSSGNYFYVAIENADEGHWGTNVQFRFYTSKWSSYQGGNTFSPESGHTVTSGKYWRINVPSGATKVQVQSNTSGNQYTSGEWTLSNGGAMKLNSTASNMTAWDSGKSDVYGGSGDTSTSGTWFYSSGTDGNTSKGYEYITTGSQVKYGSNMAIGKFTHNSKDYPMHSQVVSPDSYYVVILYPDTDYGVIYPDDTSDGVGSSSKYRVYASKILPGQVLPESVRYVDIYAKNGMLRDSTFNRFTNLAKTKITSITYPDGTVKTSGGYAYGDQTTTWDNNVTGYSSSYAHLTNVPVGSKVTIETELSPNGETFTGSTKFSASHYLKAYSFNGYSYKVHTPSEGEATTNGVKFTETWTVEEINTTNMGDAGNVVEINPIYYLRENSNTKTFYIDGYEGDLQKNWGTTLAVYPYYEGKSNKENAFGGYPGQPMLFYGGKYQMEVPLTVDGTVSGAQVKGLTLHNAYWDLLHRSIDKKCDDAHRQTYDYDDFYKLYKEKTTDSIIFWFKYKDKDQHDNYADTDEYTDYDFAQDTEGTGDIPTSGLAITSLESKNGVEIVTDYYGRQVDAFGTLIASSTDKTTYTSGTESLKGNELLFVSTGYKDTYVGEYATIWAVYNQTAKGSFSFLGYISSSMLYLNKIENVSKYTDGTNTANGKMSWSAFISTYNTLKASYQGKPALISYEKEILNNSKDKAWRSDGKWFYSTGKEKVQADVKIQYVNSTTAPEIDSNLWNDDTFGSTGLNGELNVGTTTGCSAYFTNTTPEYLVGKTSSGKILVNNEDFFTFKAEAAGTYKFVGWVRYSGGHYYDITTNKIAASNISANDTYIARFKQVESGSLVISHNIGTGTVSETNYTGTGTRYLKVEIKNGDKVIKTYESDDGSEIDVSKYINENNDSFKIYITARTVGDADNIPALRTVTPVYYKLWPDSDSTESYNSSTYTLEQTSNFTVGTVRTGGNATNAIRYKTYLTKPALTYNYSITYNYTSRMWGDQSYTVEGTDIDELTASRYFTGSKTGARLLDSFIKSSTPYEKNFRKTIKWDYQNATKGCTLDPVAENTYNLTAVVNSTNTVDDTVTAEFLLPYKYTEDTVTDGVVTYSDKKGVKFDVYDGDTKTGQKEYAYDDESYPSFTLTSKVGSLFEYNNPATPKTVTESSKASDFNLVEAAPYVIKDPSYKTERTSEKRYYTGDSFEVDGVTYYLESFPEGSGLSVEDSTHKLITKDAVKNNPAGSNYTVTFTKPGKTTTTTYQFAVQASNGDIYFFAYAQNASEQPVDNSGNVLDDVDKYVFNGQYIVYHELDKKIGINSGSYTKKYFTRWDVYDTNGKYITSSFYNQFNYCGYQNYVVKPVYESDSPSASPATFDGSNKDTDIATSINFIDSSRNQWNKNGKGTYPGSDASEKGDKIFTDFTLSFFNKGERINLDDNTVKAGIVIEILGKVEDLSGSAVTDIKQDANTDVSYYTEKYNKGTSFQYNAESVKSYVQAKVTGSGPAPTLPCNGSWYLPVSTMDNFNRLHYTYTFTQTDNTHPLRTQGQYVYRATSFISVNNNGTWTTEVSSAPEYFLLYDIASR